MENQEVKAGFQSLPQGYVPIYLIDHRNPGPMAMILYFGIFIFDALLITVPIFLFENDFTLAVPEFSTNQQVIFLIAVLLCLFLMWNFHEIVRLIYCAVLSKGRKLKYRFRPVAPAASIKDWYWSKKTFYVYLLLPPVLFTIAFFVGMALTGTGAFFWMFLLFQVPSLLACYHPINDAMILSHMPDYVLIYKQGWQTKFYAPDGTKTGLKAHHPKPPRRRK